MIHRPSKSVANKVAIVIPDQHAPLYHAPSINVVLKAIGIIKPDIVINLGDIGENEGASGWQWKRKQRPPVEYILPIIDLDVKKINTWLDLLDSACDRAGVDRRVVTAGNHDEWIDLFGEHYGVLQNFGYTAKKQYRGDERGYEWYPYGDYAKLGDHLYYHGGHFTNQYHAKSHAMALGMNIIYGHAHSAQTHAYPTLDGYVTARCIGFLGEMEKDFMKGRPHAWSHNFSIVYYDSAERGRVVDIEIKHGIAYINGVKVDGNKGIPECLINNS